MNEKSPPLPAIVSTNTRPAPDKRVKVFLSERLSPLARRGHIHNCDGLLRPDGLVRIDYPDDRQDADFDHILVPLSACAAVVVYRTQ